MYVPDVVGQDVHPVYIHFAIVASHRLPAMVSEVTGHANTSSVKSTVGPAVSKMMVSVISLPLFPNESLNLIYTVFVASPAVSVCAMLAVQDCRLVGAAELPNATCTHETPASVGQVVFNVTDVLVVYVALLFMVNDHPLGAVLS